MPWADFLSSIVTPFVATVATLAGLVVAVSQLTAGARLRKQADYWKQEYLDAELAQDKGVYQSMHRLAVGKIVARSGLPLRRLTVAVCILVVAVFLLAWGTQNLVAHQGFDGWIVFAISAGGGLIGFFISVGEYSVLNFARRNVLVSFLDGNRLIADFNVWPDRQRAFRVLGRRGALEVLIVAISACAVVVVATVQVSALLKGEAAIPEWVSPAAYLAYPSIIYLLFAFAGSSNFKRSEVWIHPRPLTATAGIAAVQSHKEDNEEGPTSDSTDRLTT